VNLDTPIGPEELWRDANSCARCRSPTCAVPYDDRLAVRDHREVLLLAAPPARWWSRQIARSN
jgi:hypothetical protein